MSPTTAAARTATENIYVPEIAELVRVQKMSALETLFEVRLPGGRDLGHVPGQFVQVSLMGIGEAPISICSSPLARGTFELVVRDVGNLTSALHRLKAGDTDRDPRPLRQRVRRGKPPRKGHDLRCRGARASAASLPHQHHAPPGPARRFRPGHCPVRRQATFGVHLQR